MTTNWMLDAHLGSDVKLSLIEAILSGIGTFGTNTRVGIAAGYVATSSTSSVAVRATIYTAPGNNAQRSIKSSSANDTAAGTGAQQVTITYYDANCNGPNTEVVTLNGTTAVNTVNTNIALIEKMVVSQVGSSGGNAGTISLMTGLAGAGSTIGSIAASDNTTFWAHHYVATGATAFVTGILAGSTLNAGASTLNVLNPINSAIPQYNPGGTLRHGTTTNSIPYPVPISVVGPAIVWMNEKSDLITAQTVFVQFGWFDLT